MFEERVLITPPYNVTKFLSELHLLDLPFVYLEKFVFAYLFFGLFVFLKLIAINQLFDSLNVSVQTEHNMIIKCLI